MKTQTAWLSYVTWRLAFFAAPFAALLLIDWPWWLALIIATLVSLSLSVIFLSRQRGAASTGIYEWRHRDRTADDIAEDATIDPEQPSEPR